MALLQLRRRDLPWAVCVASMNPCFTCSVVAACLQQACHGHSASKFGATPGLGPDSAKHIKLANSLPLPPLALSVCGKPDDRCTGRSIGCWPQPATDQAKTSTFEHQACSSGRLPWGCLLWAQYCKVSSCRPLYHSCCCCMMINVPAAHGPETWLSSSAVVRVEVQALHWTPRLAQGWLRQNFVTAS